MTTPRFIACSSISSWAPGYLEVVIGVGVFVGLLAEQAKADKKLDGADLTSRSETLGGCASTDVPDLVNLQSLKQPGRRRKFMVLGEHSSYC